MERIGDMKEVEEKIELTNRQLYIIKLMCQDYNNKNLATKLKCSLSLIEKEVKAIKVFYEVQTNSAVIYKYLTQ